jgi:hypothetical protein
MVHRLSSHVIAVAGSMDMLTQRIFSEFQNDKGSSIKIIQRVDLQRILVFGSIPLCNDSYLTVKLFLALQN